MKVITVKRSHLASENLRLDASYHLSDGPLTRIKLERLPYNVTTLGQASKTIFKGDIFKRVYVDNPAFGLPFMTGSDMMKSEILSGKYVSKKYTNADNLIIEKGWILVSRSGTLGNVVYTNGSFEGIVGTDDLIRIIPANSSIKSGCLYAYLASTYGYGLLTQSAYGGVVQHIEPHHIEDLPVPIFPESLQNTVDALIAECSSFKHESRILLEKANDYFDSLFSSSSEEPKICKKSLADILAFQCRFDASFINLFEFYSENIKTSNVPYNKLGSYTKSIFIPNRGKRNYVNNGIKYLSTSDISSTNPTRIRKFLSKKSKGINSVIVEKDWILVARSGQEILGSVFYVGNQLNGVGVNEHALRVVVDKSMSHYIYAFLSSKFGKRYLRSGIFGSAILTINEDFLQEILIPLFDDDVKNEITFLVQESIKLSDQAMVRECTAIELIEKEIERWQN